MEIRQLLSADFQLLKDLAFVPHSSSPTRLTTVGAVTFFEANGSELWKTDGTEAGTTLVKTMSDGHSSTWMGETVNGNGVLYFSANAGSNGLGIWKSDGTDAGTVLVTAAPVSTAGTLPFNLSFVNGHLYFETLNDQQQRSLWKSDGTTNGTTVVRDISTNASSIAIGQSGASVTIGNSLLLPVNHTTTGSELWRSDGTASGTGLLKDIRPGAEGSSPGEMTTFGAAKYFAANDGTHGRELWKTDGTSGGTVLVKDLVSGATGSDPQNIVVSNGSLYFTTTDNAGKFSLWKSDGTSTGTVELKQFSQSGTIGLGELTQVNGTLFFAVRLATNDELWKTDGTVAGTQQVAPISGGRNFSRFNNINGKLYFSASQFATGTELWTSDGTPLGTFLVRDLNPGADGSNPTDLTVLNGRLLFSASTESGNELWTLNAVGTPELLKDVNPQVDGQASSGPEQFTEVNGNLFFVTDDNRLWKTNGRPGGTVRLTPDAFVTEPDWLTEVNGRLYFSTAYGNSIWTSDGTVEGTKLVKSISLNSFNRNPFNLVNVNGTLMFTADDGANGFELWKSDGTEAGTVMVSDIDPGASSGFPQQFVVNDGILYFRAYSSQNGRALWKSDGTASGTVAIRDEAFSGIYGGPTANVGGTLYFTGLNAQGVELWKSDGTTTGTVFLKDTSGDTNSGYPTTFVDHNGSLFFLANHSQELWTSDGTSDGTRRIPTNPAAQIIKDSGMISAGDYTYFIASDSTNGTELWRSDGTEAGTHLVKDLRPGTDSSSPVFLAEVDGSLYFTADDGVNGRELWKSDGTEAGTMMVFDFTGDATSSNPSEVALLGDRIIVVASTADTGQEMFVNFDPNRAPTDLSLTGSSLAENSPLQTVVGTLSTIDPDADNTHTYSLASGYGDIDNARFSISGNQLQIASNLNFEEKSTYSIRVRATDQADKYFEKTFTVTVTNVNDAPSAVRLTNAINGIAEFISVANGIKVGDVVIDDDSLGTNSLSISGADASHFTLVGRQVYLKAGSILNRISKPTYRFTVNVDDPTVGTGIDASLNLELPVTRNWTTITGPSTVSSTQRPTITWTPVGGATKYYVWIRNATTNVQDFLVTTARSTSFTPSTDLGIGKFVVWVRPVGASEEKGSWSSRFEFQVSAPPTFMPMLAQNGTTRPTLHWNSLRGAATTDLWIANMTTGQREAVRVANVRGTTWTAPSDLPMGSYRAWIRGVDAQKNAAQWSTPIDFLVLPAVDQVGPVGFTNSQPEFRWNAVPGATGYNLVVTDATTNATVLTKSFSATTSYMPATALSAGRYTWSVSATLRGGAQSATATASVFTVVDTPVLLTPAATTSVSSPTFSWTNFDGATKYRLLVRTTDESTPYLIDKSNLTSTSYTPSSALPSGNYRAWIQALGVDGTWGPLSKQYSFSVA